MQKLPILLLVLWFYGASAQNPSGQVLGKQDVIEMLSPKGIAIGGLGQNSFKYTGNVKIRHQGALLFCDQAIHQVTANRLDAVGHVLIVQGDTIIIKADTLVYLGNSQQAVLHGRVTFQDRRIVLTAVQLDYNLTSGLAHYSNRGRLVDSRIVLTSREGYYESQSRQIELLHTVRLVSPENTLTADALIYNTGSRLATLVEPTRITGKDGVSVVQQGQYNTQEGVLQQNAITEKPKYTSLTDSLARITYSETGGVTNSKMLDAGPVFVAQASGVVRTVAGKSVVKPTGTPAPKLPAAPVKKADTTDALVSSLTPQTRRSTPAAKPKAVARNLTTARSEPIKREETGSEAVTMVPTEKPDEQVLLSTTNTAVLPTKKLEPLAPVMTAEPQPTTATVAQQQPASPPQAQASSADLVKVSDTTAVSRLTAETVKAAVETTPKVTDEKLLSPVDQPVKQAPTVDVATASVPIKKANEPVKLPESEARKGGPPASEVRQVANPPAGQRATIRAALVTPTKRAVAPTTPLRAVPDPEESDLERQLNRKKRSN